MVAAVLTTVGLWDEPWLQKNASRLITIIMWNQFKSVGNGKIFCYSDDSMSIRFGVDCAISGD